MRVPKIISTDSNDAIREDVYKIGYFDTITMGSENWQHDEAELNKRIKYIEKLVRSSYEYKELIKFLKEEIDMNKCAFFPDLNREDGITLEIHHAPFTLYDITAIILNETRVNDANMSPFAVADKVMQAHFNGLVGLIPLSYTVHKLVHNGDVFIPLTHVHGNVKRFYELYSAYMTEDQLSVLERNVRETNLLNAENYHPTVLERRYTYLEIDGFKIPQLIASTELEVVETATELSLDNL